MVFCLYMPVCLFLTLQCFLRLCAASLNHRRRHCLLWIQHKRKGRQEPSLCEIFKAVIDQARPVGEHHHEIAQLPSSMNVFETALQLLNLSDAQSVPLSSLAAVPAVIVAESRLAQKDDDNTAKGFFYCSVHFVFLIIPWEWISRKLQWLFPYWQDKLRSCTGASGDEKCFLY